MIVGILDDEMQGSTDRDESNGIEYAIERLPGSLVQMMIADCENAGLPLRALPASARASSLRRSASRQALQNDGDGHGSLSQVGQAVMRTAPHGECANGIAPRQRHRATRSNPRHRSAIARANTRAIQQEKSRTKEPLAHCYCRDRRRWIRRTCLAFK